VDTQAEGTAAAGEPLVNIADVASVYGVSQNTIKAWINDLEDPMPVVTKGGNGVAYEIRLSEVRVWDETRKARADAAAAAKSEFLAQERMKFLGLKPEDEGQTGLSPAQMKELAQAQLVIMTAAEKRRALIHTDEVRDLLNSLQGEYRAGLEGLADWMEREFDLDGEQVERAVVYLEGVMNGVLRRIAKANLEEGEEAPDQGALF
jgi:phage terminase Nu1 subunit (DNA packaging protein)